jgi:SAM-dependent methyltransferase
MPQAERRTSPRMDAAGLLQEIADYCRVSGMAESTFGRRAVNDGKFAGRLRFGGRVTHDTVDRVRRFIAANPAPAGAPALLNGVARPAGAGDPLQNFRFYDNRQKYLMFVNTCSEKWIVAGRAALELANIHPRPPAVRLFDAGVGDGTVLTRVMRAMHRRFALMPFYVVGKEISLEDVRLALEKMPDRFTEHPATVLVMTNLNYAEAPWLTPASIGAATGMVWHEVPLAGNSAAEFEEQITALQPFLARHWRARISKTSGNPVYEQPVALVLYREDCRFLLDQVKPRRGEGRADYDLVIASQPYRARASVDFKARRVLAPLARSLAPGGRLIGIHSRGNDPGLEIVRLVWPEESPFQTNRHDLLKATRAVLGRDARGLNFNAYADPRSLFRYDMHTLPDEIGGSGTAIGTSTLLAAWNAATYVAQIEDERLGQAMRDTLYLDATRDVLKRQGGLWFWDESYVISRKRDLV